MFYCNDCAKKNEWSETGMKSNGRCECCGESAVCNERSSSMLPLPKEKPVPTDKTNPWTKVSEGLPDVNGSVNIIVYVDTGNGYPYMRFARYTEWGFHYPTFDGNSGSVLFDVTHWMYSIDSPPDSDNDYE